MFVVSSVLWRPFLVWPCKKFRVCIIAVNFCLLLIDSAMRPILHQVVDALRVLFLGQIIVILIFFLLYLNKLSLVWVACNKWSSHKYTSRVASHFHANRSWEFFLGIHVLCCVTMTVSFRNSIILLQYMALTYLSVAWSSIIPNVRYSLVLLVPCTL